MHDLKLTFQNPAPEKWMTPLNALGQIMGF